MNNYAYSAAGLALTKEFEGLSLNAYRDSGGVWTIGYGHTGKDVHEGMTITEAEAEALLEHDIAWAVAAVNRLVTWPIDQCQFDALVDFTFNLGAHAFSESTLLRLLNAGDYAGAENQILLWVHDKGHQVQPGLVRRRAAEAHLFAGSPVGSLGRGQ